VRLFDGDRPAEDVLVHLTRAEARETVSALSDLLDDVERWDFPVVLSTIVDGVRQVTFYVYTDEETLEADPRA
jgi:hypothetical protein